MEDQSSSKKARGHTSPLWVVTAFVALTEAVSCVTIIQVTGGVQVALTCFVFIFPILVGLGFFSILWDRPENFYSPAEYGGVDPKSYMDSLRRRNIPDQLAQKIKEAEAKPKDDDAQFALMDSFLDEVTRQHLILMYEKKAIVPSGDFTFVKFETGNTKKGTWSAGGISGREIAKKLGGSNLVSIQPQDFSVSISELGSRFAQWLVATGKKNDYYSSALGGWGEVQRPKHLPPEFLKVNEDMLTPTPGSSNSSSTIESQSKSSSDSAGDGQV